MPFKYSNDFRRKAIEAEEVSEMLNISTSAIYKWMKLKRETGDVAPRSSKPTKKSKIT